MKDRLTLFASKCSNGTHVPIIYKEGSPKPIYMKRMRFQAGSGLHNQKGALGAAATCAATAAAAAGGGLPCILHLLLAVHDLQALADQADLPLHVSHGVLHLPHLPLQCSSDCPVRLPLGLVLLPQLPVAVVLALALEGEQGAAAHVAELPPVLAALGVRLQVPPKHLGPAAPVRAGHRLVQAGRAVAVLL